MGIQAVSVPIVFPVLYEPFFGSQAAYQPYLTFYSQVAQAVRAAGLKLIVDNEILYSNDIAAGWTNMNAFYSTLTWPQYVAARAQMAATIAKTIQPDYLLVAEEPDTEATQTGQQNLNNPADTAQMVAAEIAAVQGLNLSKVPKLGAGVGTWLVDFADYINAYDLLPLDYIDFHVLTINTISQFSFLDNALIIASMAAAAGKPVAISQAWPTKVAAGEWNVLPLDEIRARGPFSFWAPLDDYFLQTMQALAKYTQMVYMVPEFPVYFSAYQTYGGTLANGGAANCTCTSTSCSDYVIMQTENSLASAAISQMEYTTTAFSYYNQLVTPPDTTPPSAPTILTGTAGYTAANLAWAASSDNVGVVGYNVYRCIPPAFQQPCAAGTNAWIADTDVTAFNDSGLTANTPYNYQVEGYDLAKKHSPLATLSLQTHGVSVDSVPSLAATVISPKEIDLSWAAPSNTSNLNKYLIYSGPSASSLQQVGVALSTQLTFKNLSLAPGTTYWYGVVAVDSEINAPMSPLASAATLPLPDHQQRSRGAYRH